MKKAIIISAFLLPVQIFAQSSAYKVNLTLKNLKGSPKVYLGYAQDKQMHFDTADFKNGTATFQGTLDEPRECLLAVDHNGIGLHGNSRDYDRLKLYIDKGLTTVIGKDSVKNATVKDSKLNDDYNRYKNLMAATDRSIDSMYQVMGSMSSEQKNDTAYANKFQSSIMAKIAEKQALDQQFIKANPKSYVSLIAVSHFVDYQIDGAVIGPLYDGLDASLKATPKGQELGQIVATAQKTMVGAMAPDFTQNTPDDKPVALSSLRGKYVLLDFWASWCEPCRDENPNVVKAYNQFKDKNFTILSVSLDNSGKKQRWLDAIKEDGLEWTQISDLQGWNNAAVKLYGIRGIPENFLLDPSGKIIAKGLRGDALIEKLTQVLN